MVLNDNKIQHKYNKGYNNPEEMNYILNEIYKRNFAKSTDKPFEKPSFYKQELKKLTEKDTLYRSNLIVVHGVYNKMVEYLLEFKDKILNNPTYKSLMDKLKANYKSTGILSANIFRTAEFWRDEKNSICGVISDINIIYKTVTRSAEDIQALLRHPLQVIRQEMKVKLCLLNNVARY